VNEARHDRSGRTTSHGLRALLRVQDGLVPPPGTATGSRDTWPTDPRPRPARQDADTSTAGSASASPVPLIRPGSDHCAKPRQRIEAQPRQRIECGDLPVLVQRDGTWLYRGSPIRRKELVCLFSSVLKRMADGSFWLETPAERGRIEVEDTPWIAGELEWSGHGRDQVLSFRTNVDQVVTAGSEHPIRVSHDWITSEPKPYITIRPGAAGGPPLEARISRAVYYELVALAVPECVGGLQKLGVWSQRSFFPLGDLPGEIGDAD
jgi:hypothetical protein